MKEKKKNKSAALVCLLFSGFLLLNLLLFCLLPKSEFSEEERRYLQSVPEFSLQAVLSGKFSQETEDYLADHVPGRKFYIGLNALHDRLTLRQTLQEIYVGESGRLYERPAAENEAVVTGNLTAIRTFAETVDQTVDLMLIPSAGAVLQEDMGGLADPYPDFERIEEIYARAGEKVRPVELTKFYSDRADREKFYYRTDPHLTSYGAYFTAAAYLKGKGLACPEESQFTIETVPGFYGSCYTRSALWNTPSEELELWHSGSEFRAEIDGMVSDSVFVTENLDSADMYTVYLDGNHSLVRLDNLSCRNGRSLLVIRDSFSNCMGSFLAEGYEKVVLVDLRYYKYPVSELCAQEGFDDILIEYSLNNFLNSSNLNWLE